jgi:hypothetical protein
VAAPDGGEAADIAAIMNRIYVSPRTPMIAAPSAVISTAAPVSPSTSTLVVEAVRAAPSPVSEPLPGTATKGPRALTVVLPPAATTSPAASKTSPVVVSRGDAHSSTVNEKELFAGDKWYENYMGGSGSSSTNGDEPAAASV